MGRPSRIHFPGAVYHVMARGVAGQGIFVDDADRTDFLEGLRRVASDAGAVVIAYCLMGNHFHLAVRVGQVSLSSFMQRLLTSYCMRFNVRHDRTGHLFQARFKAILCLDDRYLIGLIRYIHMNPVRAGMAASPGDWPWSSSGSVDDGAVDFPEFEPWPDTKRLQVDLRRLPGGEATSLEAIVATIVDQTGIRANVMRSKSRNRSVTAARRRFVAEAYRNGYKLGAVARWLNTTPRSVSRYARENTVLSSGLTP